MRKDDEYKTVFDLKQMIMFL